MIVLNTLDVCVLVVCDDVGCLGVCGGFMMLSVLVCCIVVRCGLV